MMYVLICFIALTAVCTTCVSKRSTDPRGDVYAGSATCGKCHRKIMDEYRQTAHFLSVRPATLANINGSFDHGRNKLNVGAGQELRMEKKPDGLYQTLYVNGAARQEGKFALTIGSVKGQTYVQFKEGKFFQLPASWFSLTNTWMLSPGFRPEGAGFDRPVVSRCFQCHSSWVSEQPSGTQASVWNIDCERCHGPAASHVNFYTDHQGNASLHSLADVASLPRERKIDLCAVCHAGNGNILLRSTFTFCPGDSLAQYMIVDYTGSMPIDVHGNQVGLLKKSKCFKGGNLDCTTCHNVHENQRGNANVFNSVCLSCHKAGRVVECPLAQTSDSALIVGNCVRCHMPSEPSTAIVMNGSDGSRLSARVVNHDISIYPGQSKQFLHQRRY